MNRNFLFVALLALALSIMACGVRINLPVTDVKTGPTETEDIQIPTIDAESVYLDLKFGAGELHLSPGAENAFVDGTAVYNVPDFKPKISQTEDTVRLETGELNIKGIPNFNSNIKNDWDLKLGSQPLKLNIEAGAYKGRLELGGLSLEELEVNDGAADVDLSFSEPNRVEMESFRYKTGASKLYLEGLANANFERMTFSSGAGEYTLEFSGDLMRDMTVNIESGISSVTLIVPEGVSARVIFEGGFSNVDAHGEWDKNGNEYLLQGSGPTITVYVDMGAGSLELRN